MLATVLWLSTFVPGLALLVRFFPKALARGPLAIGAASFVATTALVAPLLLAAYAIELPVRTVGWLAAALLAAGTIDLARGARWRVVARTFARAWRVETWVALALIAPSVWLGGQATYDMPMHAAKVAAMREHGFGLHDPHSPLAVIETKHSVNALHGYTAIFSDAAGARPLEFLFHSHWFAVLLIVGGFEFAGSAIFGSRRVGRLAALGGVAVAYSRELAMVQNSLASYALFPIVAACLFLWLRGGSRRHLALVATGALAIGVVHLGIAVLMVLVLAPLCSLMAWHFQRPLRAGLLGGLALAPSLPFAIFSALQPNHFREQLAPIRKTLVVEVDAGFLSYRIVNTAPYYWVIPALAFLWWLHARWSARRAELAWMIGVVVIVCSWMFNPAQFALIDPFVPPWILRRMMGFARVVTVLAGAALIVAWLRARTRSPRTKDGAAWAHACAILAIVGATAATQAVPLARYFQRRHVEQAWLARARELERVVAPHLGERSLVAADPWTGLLLPSVRTCAVLAINRGHANPADADWLRREPLSSELLDPSTSLERRRQIVEGERVDFVLVDAWMARHARLEVVDGAAIASLGRVVADEDGITLVEVGRKVGRTDR